MGIFAYSKPIYDMLNVVTGEKDLRKNVAFLSKFKKLIYDELDRTDSEITVIGYLSPEYDEMGFGLLTKPPYSGFVVDKTSRGFYFNRLTTEGVKRGFYDALKRKSNAFSISKDKNASDKEMLQLHFQTVINKDILDIIRCKGRSVAVMNVFDSDPIRAEYNLALQCAKPISLDYIIRMKSCLKRFNSDILDFPDDSFFDAMAEDITPLYTYNSEISAGMRPLAVQR